jgi:hypothetical protein
MTVATEAFFRRSAGMDLGRPASREAVVEALDGGRP